MSKIETKFEVQVVTPSTGHGWKAIGGREGRVYFNENSFVETKVNTVEEARRAIKQIRADWKKHYCEQRELRIVKITVTTTYDVVKESGPKVVNIHGANYGAIQM